MKRALMAVAAALALLAPSAAAALEDEPTPASPAGVARVVEIRVIGDAAALAKVRMTARELLMRLDVQPEVKSADEPERGRSELTPLVVAYVDLRNPSAPSIDIQDGKTRQELTRRNVSDATSLETGVEAVLHVLYLTVESTLQVGASRPALPSNVAAPVPTRPTAKPRAKRSGLGFDLGPLLRLSSLGGDRIVAGGGIALEPRADVGRGSAGLCISGSVHSATQLAFGGAVAEVRPLQLRAVPTFDWLLSPQLSGVLGVGAGVDSLSIEPVQTPEASRSPPRAALDPVVTGVVGARVPIAGPAFLSALASLDLDLAPTSFVARQGGATEPLLTLPRLRAGFTLALSFTAAGSNRFSQERWEQ